MSFTPSTDGYAVTAIWQAPLSMLCGQIVALRAWYRIAYTVRRMQQAGQAPMSQLSTITDLHTVLD